MEPPEEGFRTDWARGLEAEQLRSRMASLANVPAEIMIQFLVGALAPLGFHPPQEVYSRAELRYRTRPEDINFLRVKAHQDIENVGMGKVRDPDGRTVLVRAFMDPKDRMAYMRRRYEELARTFETMRQLDRRTRSLVLNPDFRRTLWNLWLAEPTPSLSGLANIQAGVNLSRREDAIPRPSLVTVNDRQELSFTWYRELLDAAYMSAHQHWVFSAAMRLQVRAKYHRKEVLRLFQRTRPGSEADRAKVRSIQIAHRLGCMAPGALRIVAQGGVNLVIDTLATSWTSSRLTDVASRLRYLRIPVFHIKTDVRTLLFSLVPKRWNGNVTWNFQKSYGMRVLLDDATVARVGKEVYTYKLVGALARGYGYSKTGEIRAMPDNQPGIPIQQLSQFSNIRISGVTFQQKSDLGRALRLWAGPPGSLPTGTAAFTMHGALKPRQPGPRLARRPQATVSVYLRDVRHRRGDGAATGSGPDGTVYVDLWAGYTDEIMASILRGRVDPRYVAIVPRTQTLSDFMMTPQRNERQLQDMVLRSHLVRNLVPVVNVEYRRVDLEDVSMPGLPLGPRKRERIQQAIALWETQRINEWVKIKASIQIIQSYLEKQRQEKEAPVEEDQPEEWRALGFDFSEEEEEEEEEGEDPMLVGAHAGRRRRRTTRLLNRLLPGANHAERQRTWQYALWAEGGVSNQAKRRVVQRLSSDRLYYHKLYQSKGPGPNGLSPGRLVPDSFDYIDLQLGDYDDGGEQRYSIVGPGGERETYLWMDF